MKLICPNNTKILIIKVYFGRDKNSSACGDSYKNTSCTTALETENFLKNVCGNTHICVENVTSSRFPNKCKEVTKILKVWFQCVEDGKIFYSYCVL